MTSQLWPIALPGSNFRNAAVSAQPATLQEFSFSTSRRTPSRSATLRHFANDVGDAGVQSARLGHTAEGEHTDILHAQNMRGPDGFMQVVQPRVKLRLLAGDAVGAGFRLFGRFARPVRCRAGRTSASTSSGTRF